MGKSNFIKSVAFLLFLATSFWGGTAKIYAQNSFGAPGGQTSEPAPGVVVNSQPSNGIGWNPGPQNSWGSPWGGYGPMIVNSPLSSPDWQSNGITNVIAVGYDAQGNFRTLPLRVAYTFNGANYDVEVLNAWNPWTDMWNYGIDQPAYQTVYMINGQTFNYYTPLSTGTYYFNL